LLPDVAPLTTNVGFIVAERRGTTPFSPLRGPAKKTYLVGTAAWGWVREVPMSRRGEDTFAMISGLAVFGALCIAALISLG
jgi:hypothetical protein